jgi:uncharacterized protein YcbK (DUF882 family)
MTDLLQVSRRQLLQYGMAGLAALAVTGIPIAEAEAAAGKTKGRRLLSFRNLHTDEKLQVAYWQDGKYDNSALKKIYHIMRDHRTGTSRVMDTRLIDTLHDLQKRLKSDGVIEIISGYRSPKSNAMLARNSDGVARKSFHVQGKAIDIQLSDKSLRQIYNAALTMKRGGVSLYNGSGFVHVDTGPFRTW